MLIQYLTLILARDRIKRENDEHKIFPIITFIHQSWRVKNYSANYPPGDQVLQG